MGRTFSPDEDRVPLGDAVAVLSDAAWKSRFGGDANIVGKHMQLDEHTYTIIGVAPAGFLGLTDQAEVWVPFVMAGSAEELGDRGTRGFRVLARLRSGVHVEQAQAELDGISSRLARSYSATNEARGVEVSPLEREVLSDFRKPLLVLLAAVGFVLLIACTNVANLPLARSEARRHEIAMRMALGAGRRRLIRQLIAESAVLVAFGCAAGIACAFYAIRVLMSASPMQLPTYIHPSVDAAVILFTILVCAVVTLALSLTPATQIGSAGFEDSLNQNSGRSTSGRRGARLQDVLAVAEVSLSVLLLIGAGLAIRSLQHLAAINPGYDPNHVVNFRISLPEFQLSGGAAADQPDSKVVVAANDILGRIHVLPSVESAAIATDTPLIGSSAIFYTAEGQPPMNAHTMPRAYFHRVSGDFFRTLHTRFLFGRGFTEHETRNNANVAIVTQNLVRRFWLGQDPLGKRIKVGGVKSTRLWLTIVGVIGDLKYRSLSANPTADPDLFQVFNERSRDFSLFVRTATPPETMLATIRHALRQADPAITIYHSGTLEELVRAETSRPRFLGWLMGSSPRWRCCWP